MRRTIFLGFLVLGLATASPGEPVRRASHPALSPNGDQLIVSWQGDLWSLPATGGAARRLTVSPAVDMMQKWAPDGKRIFFASNRFGSYDVFSVRPDGGDLRRLTFDSATEYPHSVSPDGATLYGYTTAWGRLDLFRMKATGGEMVRLTAHPFESAYHPAITQDGKSVVHVRGGSAGSWRKARVQGSVTSDLWVAGAGAPLGASKRITRDGANDLFPLAGPGGSITWVSNRGGHPNLWRMKADGSGARQLTQHRDGTMRYPSMSADGTRVVYEFDSAIYLWDAATGRSNQLSVEMPDDARENPVLDTTLSTGVQDFAVSPDGKRTVLVLRGDLWLIPEKGGTTRRLTDFPGFDGQPMWLDAKTVVFVSARTGKRELFKVDLDGKISAFASDLLDLTEPALSPDGKWIALHRGDREIVVMAASGGTLRTIATGAFSSALRGSREFAWSPDSKWIAALETLERCDAVQCIEVQTGAKQEIARLPRGGTLPQFLPNGRGVYFTAFDREDADVFVVDLVPADLTFSEDDLDKIDAPKEAAGGAVQVRIDPRGIERRMRRISSGGAFALIAAPDSRAIWASANGQLVAIPVSGGAASPVAGVTGSPSMILLQGAKLYMTLAGRLVSMPATGQAAPTPVPFSAAFTVDRQAEQMELFHEIWWSMSRLFYDPKLHGKDWNAVREKYARLVPYAFDRAEFYDLMDEMVEEMDSSHLGTTSPEPGPALESQPTGWLGIEWDWRALDARGAYVVAAVAEGSPASHPQSELKPGDRVLTVDGKAAGSVPLAQMLDRKSGRRVRLGIERGGKTLEVAIQPASSALRSTLNYENWVAWQRAETERLSGGTLTYVHIQGMNAPSHQRFLREIRTLTPGKRGVVIDVRYNGGGNTAHEALGVLIKTPWLIRTQRDVPGAKISENIWRGDSLELPSALMINHASFSNAEILAEGFRRLKVGPIIGEPTAGGVIGTSSMTFFDGGSMRVPAIGSYAIDGENLEGKGRKPDVEVPFDPNAWAEGRDVQLERAVEELMRRVAR